MGLINFGLEVMNLKNIPVYVMSRMKQYIEGNSLFNQLVINGNIFLNLIEENKQIKLDNNVIVSSFEVPHRNELSETVGFKVESSNQSVIYLPDIDSWDNFDKELNVIVKENDLLFLDGTFFTKNEITNRDVSKIPHPEILDTMSRLSNFSDADKKKVNFIHFNHTNGILNEDHKIYNEVLAEGFSLSKEGQVFNFNNEA